METKVYLGLDTNIIPVNNDEVTYLHRKHIFVHLTKGDHAAFFFDKLGEPNWSDELRLAELFDYLSSIGNVVATNHERFYCLLSSDDVASRFLKDVNTRTSAGHSGDLFNNTYCTLQVPAMTKLLDIIASSERALYTLEAVGFVRKPGFPGDWDFESSFVVFKRDSERDVVFSDPIDTTNTAICEIFESLRDGNTLSPEERVVALLSV